MKWAFFATIVFLLFLGAGAALVFIEYVRPDKDNVALHVVVFGFITTNVTFLIRSAMQDATLDKQNIVLDQVHDKVNGGTERAMSALREQHRVEMHDKNNELNNMKLKLEMERAECIKSKEELAALKATKV